MATMVWRQQLKCVQGVPVTWAGDGDSGGGVPEHTGDAAGISGIDSAVAS